MPRGATKRDWGQGSAYWTGAKRKFVASIVRNWRAISAEKEYSDARMERVMLNERKQLLLNKLEAINAKNDRWGFYFLYLKATIANMEILKPRCLSSFPTCIHADAHVQTST